MKRVSIVIVLAVSVALNPWLLSSQAGNPLVPTVAIAQSSGDPLASYMGVLQRHAHKLGLAIDAGNKDLAAFYVTKIEEESANIAKKFPTFEKFQVGALVGAMLNPVVAPVGAAVASGDMAGASAKYDAMLTGCNNCHTATQRPFIKITRSKTNAFAQSFK